MDTNDSEQRERLTIKPATLQSLFDVYLKTTARMKGAPAPASASAAAAQSAAAGTGATSSFTATTPTVPTAEDKKAADALKGQGNSYMSARKYDEAIEAYTKAAKLDPTNPVYFSNRAAAYSSIDDYDSAIEDAKKAADLDPTFVKAYSRLGYV